MGKCLNGYLGVVTDTLADGSYYVSDPLTDTAYYESVSISAFGDGYKAVGDAVLFLKLVQGLVKGDDL